MLVNLFQAHLGLSSISEIAKPLICKHLEYRCSASCRSSDWGTTQILHQAVSSFGPIVCAWLLLLPQTSLCKFGVWHWWSVICVLVPMDVERVILNFMIPLFVWAGIRITLLVKGSLSVANTGTGRLRSPRTHSMQVSVSLAR